MSTRNNTRALGRRFADQTVLVTGACGGLGQSMAHRFQAEGAHVVLWDIEAGVEQFASALRSNEGPRATAMVIDITDTKQVERGIATILADRDRIDVLVNNAGLIMDGRIENMSDDSWSKVIDVNLSAVFKVSRAVLPAMKVARYGRIVSMASISRRGNFGQANYSAAKAGVVAVARAIALESAEFGITSNVVSPGAIMTPMLASMKADVRDSMCASIPVGRIGEPEDIAAAVTFLASSEASFITGAVLDVDGGLGLPFIRT